MDPVTSSMACEKPNRPKNMNIQKHDGGFLLTASRVDDWSDDTYVRVTVDEAIAVLRAYFENS